MIAIPRVCERCLRDNEATRRVAELFNVRDYLESVGPLGCAHRDKNDFVCFVEGGGFRRARIVFSNETERVGVDRSTGEVFIFHAVFGRKHFRQLLLFFFMQLVQSLGRFFLVECGHVQLLYPALSSGDRASVILCFRDAYIKSHTSRYL